VNPTPVNAAVAFGLLAVNVSVVELLSGTVAAAKAFVKLGGATTVSVALDVSPVPPSVEDTVTELFFTPADVPVTFREKVHDAPAVSDAPLRLTELAVAVAVIVPPPQLPLRLFGVATTRPAGSVSVKPMPVSGPLAAGLVTVNPSDVDPPSATDDAPKAFPIWTAPATCSEAVAVFPVPPFVDVTVTELFFVPLVVPVTLTVNVHVPPAGSRMPVADTPPDPATALPWKLAHVEAAPLGVATTRPAGKVSVSPTPLSASSGLGLVSVNVIVLVPFSAIDDGANAFAITGGASTVRVAVAAEPLPPSLEAIVDVVFTFAPALVPVTASEIVHDALAASVAPLRLTRDDPGTAEIVPGGAQLWLNMLLVATTRPAGKVSE
jgi:hypothetical protein